MKQFFISIIFLIIGMCLYLLRDISTYFPPTFFSNFILYNLSDGLWTSSGILILSSIWKNKKEQLPYGILFLIISLLFEFLQKYQLVIGYFDIIDIITILIFGLITIIINLKYSYKKVTADLAGHTLI
ncbi:hypothetical protein DV872_25935 [Oceanispirochaeta sp. M1]|nr:hypothetical protein DV872_25935 [Oceanispirochaeta sp. M1]